MPTTTRTRQSPAIATVLDTIADDLETKVPTTPAASYAVWTATVELIRGYAVQARRNASPVFSVVTLLDGLRRTLDNTRNDTVDTDQRSAIVDLVDELDAFTAGTNHHVGLRDTGYEHHHVIVRAPDISTAEQRAKNLDLRYLASTQIPDVEIRDVASVVAHFPF